MQKLLERNYLIQRLEQAADWMFDEGYSFTEVVQALSMEDLDLLRRKKGIQHSLAEMMGDPDLVPAESLDSSPP